MRSDFNAPVHHSPAWKSGLETGYRLSRLDGFKPSSSKPVILIAVCDVTRDDQLAAAVRAWVSLFFVPFAVPLPKNSREGENLFR